MEEHGMYFGKKEFYQIIKNIGGTWNDSQAKARIQKYMNFDKKNISF